jgi:hypothetical protein
MRISKTAAAVAALLAVVLIAISLPADSTPGSARAESRSDEPGIHSIQTRSTLRGQAWATELFGRRYGRNLLAAVVPDSRSGEISA